MVLLVYPLVSTIGVSHTEESGNEAAMNDAWDLSVWCYGIAQAQPTA